MKAMGIVREMDGLGRVVIPAEYRRIHQLTAGTQMELFLDSDGSLVLRKYRPEETVESNFDALKQSIVRNRGLKNQQAMLVKMEQLEMMLREEVAEWE